MLIPISVTNSFGQTLYVDASVGDMKKIDESKYNASGVSIVRNNEGQLVSVIRVDATRYLDDPIVDQFLKSDPKYLKKQGLINNEKINLYEVKVDYYSTECLTDTSKGLGFNDPCNWYYRTFVTMLGINDPKGEQHFGFKGLNHSYTIKSMDQVTTIWHILTKN